MAEVVRGRLVGVLVAALTSSCLAGIWLRSPMLQALAGAAAVLLALRLVGQAVRHIRLARALRIGSVPGRLGGVDLRWRSFPSGAGVAGLHRPAIYCDPRLERELTDGELNAVVLHERFHQLRRDPLRLLALVAIDPLASLTAPGRAWVERQRARLEVDADLFALGQGVDRAELAGAILKLGGVAPVGAGAGFRSAAELRLHALVSGHDSAPQAPFAGRPGWPLVATFTVGALCGVAVVHHLLSLGGSVGCLIVGC